MREKEGRKLRLCPSPPLRHCLGPTPPPVRSSAEAGGQTQPSTSGFQKAALGTVLMPAAAWCSDSPLSPMNRSVQASGRRHPEGRSTPRLKGLGRLCT